MAAVDFGFDAKERELDLRGETRSWPKLVSHDTAETRS
jgi:hypothetical protein